MLEVDEERLRPGHTQVEGAHHRRLGMLFEREGADGVLTCGRAFAISTTDPLVEFLVTSRGPLQLAHRYRRIEPMFHLGHATEASVTQSSMTFRHVASMGAPPEIPESLLVCGATIGMFLRIGVSDVTVELADARGVRNRVWPPTHAPQLASAAAPLSWTVSWDGSGRWSETLTEAKHEHLRALIATNPERTWDVRGAAAALGVSGRTSKDDCAPTGRPSAGRSSPADSTLRRLCSCEPRST